MTNIKKTTIKTKRATIDNNRGLSTTSSGTEMPKTKPPKNTKKKKK